MLEGIARPAIVKMYQHAGFDFVYIEYEHTHFSPADLADTVQSARDNGLPVIAKTPQLERQEVAKLLEAGVVGIQLPRTETRAEVEQLRSYIKFPPAGTRAVAPGWGNSDFRDVRDWKTWIAEQDRETLLVVHIETRRAYDNAEEIVETPGVDMVYCGPGDTSVEMGHPGDFTHRDVVRPMENVLKLCRERGIPWGTTAASARNAAEWVKKGATFFEAESEMNFIRAGAKNLVDDYRKLIRSEARSSAVRARPSLHRR
jgi:4-hydroxy-2-oxoheptanedioate aldolase